MKRIVFVLMLLAVTMTSSAQRLSVHSNPVDSVTLDLTQVEQYKLHLDNAGAALRRSANYEMLSWVLAACSVGAYANVRRDDTGNSKIVGATFAFLAVASKVASFNFKHTSGAELRLAAGCISVTF